MLETPSVPSPEPWSSCSVASDAEVKVSVTSSPVLCPVIDPQGNSVILKEVKDLEAAEHHVRGTKNELIRSQHTTNSVTLYSIPPLRKGVVVGKANHHRQKSHG